MKEGRELFFVCYILDGSRTIAPKKKIAPQP